MFLLTISPFLIHESFGGRTPIHLSPPKAVCSLTPLEGDPADSGRLRKKIVEIGGSVYSPKGIPQVVEE